MHALAVNKGGCLYLFHYVWEVLIDGRFRWGKMYLLFVRLGGCHENCEKMLGYIKGYI